MIIKKILGDITNKNQCYFVFYFELLLKINYLKKSILQIKKK